MTQSLAGKVILITGGASGIGRQTAIHLHGLGAHVIVSDINENDGRALVDELGEPAQYIQCDVSDSTQVEHLAKQIAEQGLALNCAINNAGIEHHNVPLAECTEEMWDKTININLKGVFLSMKSEIPLMLKNGGGHIINIASVAGLRSAPSLAPYAASKHGVVGLTKTAAVEYARAGIRVNAVCPSFIRTAMVERAMDAMDDKQKAGLTKANPLKRLGEPQEVANLIGWLCSDESTFITGQALAVDGGMLA